MSNIPVTIGEAASKIAIDTARYVIVGLEMKLEAAESRIAELEEEISFLRGNVLPAETAVRLRDWMTSEPHKPAIETFTAGAERQIAYIIEMSGLLQQVTELRAALKPFAAIPPVEYQREDIMDKTVTRTVAPHYWTVVGNPSKTHFTATDLENARKALCNTDTQNSGQI